MPSSFFVRLTAAPNVGPDIFLATPIDPNAHPEHPIVFPPGPDGVLPPAKFDWIPTSEGWIGLYGPLDKPGPLPPGFEDGQGKWVLTRFGIFFAVGPYDKPLPIEPGPPPVDPGDPPDDVEGRWVYTEKGWVWVIGPFAGGKPRPIP